MGTKNDPGSYDCYEALLETEPYFLVSARDRQAPGLVMQWALERLAKIERGEAPQEDISKVEEAQKCAEDMIKWRNENHGAWRT